MIPASEKTRNIILSLPGLALQSHPFFSLSNAVMFRATMQMPLRWEIILNFALIFFLLQQGQFWLYGHVFQEGKVS